MVCLLIFTRRPSPVLPCITTATYPVICRIQGDAQTDSARGSPRLRAAVMDSHTSTYTILADEPIAPKGERFDRLVDRKVTCSHLIPPRRLSMYYVAIFDAARLRTNCSQSYAAPLGHTASFFSLRITKRSLLLPPDSIRSGLPFNPASI